MTQQRLVILFYSLLLLTIVPLSALAQTDIFVRGSGKLYPIALPQLCVERGETSANKEIPKVVARDLDISGYFEVLNPNAYIESPGKCDARSFAYSDWSVIGAEGLVKGVVQARGSQVKVQLYLHDVQQRTIVLGKEYEGHESQLPLIAHRFANEVMRFFTGEYGVFGTQIAFSSKAGRFKELHVMDMDGSNIRRLTDDKGLSVSASWHPLGDRLVYTSYRNRVPDLFILSVDDRRVRRVTKGSALELGARFANEGGNILASRSEGKSSHIILLQPDGKTIKKLTRSSGVIDVSPDYSPDYSKVVFCSNRSGGPQIYTMNADGSQVKRISYVTSNYCTSPKWSPKGDRIAYVCRADRGFQIFTSRPDGSDALQLTSFGNNEDPDWAPNGEYIVFATTFGKGREFHLALMRKDGSNIQQLTFGRLSETQPSWSPAVG